MALSFEEVNFDDAMYTLDQNCNEKARHFIKPFGSNGVSLERVYMRNGKNW